MEIHELFEPLFTDNIKDKRYYQVYGGRGSGKSFSVSVAMVSKTYSRFKHKILYLRQNMTSSGDSTISDVQQAIEILDVESDFIFSKGVYKNKRTGSTISFKGIKAHGSQTAKLKSLSGITTVVFEEAEEIESFEEFSKIDESIRIAGKPLKVILVYNPTSAVKSWIHKEWFKDGKPDVERTHDTVFVHSTYLNNLKHLAPSTITRYQDLESKNPTYYRNVILAEWTLEVDGRIYEGWGTTDYFPDVEDPKFWYGLDFGYGGKDSTALVKIMFYEGTFYIKEVFCKSKMSINEISHAMKMNKIRYSNLVICDSAAPILIDELRLKGWNKLRKAKKGANSKEQGIKKIQGYDIIMVGENENLSFHYQTFGLDNYGNIPHEPDILAAFRYGVNHKRIAKSGGVVTGGGRVMNVNGYI